jgi:hypothetical protein
MPVAHTADRVRRLTRFLARFAELRGNGTPIPKPMRVTPSPHRLKSVMTMLRPAIVDARRAGTFINPWSIAGLGRDERRTASVLAWLLDAHGSHGGGDTYLRAVWEAAAGMRRFGFELIDCGRSVTEHCDIAIEGANFFLALELKIDAPQGPEQLARYCGVAKRKASMINKPDWAVLYISNLQENLPERCAQLSWRDVSKALKAGVETLGRPQSLGAILASRFARHVSALS